MQQANNSVNNAAMDLLRGLNLMPSRKGLSASKSTNALEVGEDSHDELF